MSEDGKYFAGQKVYNPLKIQLCIQEGGIWFMTVIYVQTQYVDLYIIWSLHPPRPLAVSCKDTTRGRKDIWPRDCTQDVLRTNEKISTFVHSSISKTGARWCVDYKSMARILICKSWQSVTHLNFTGVRCITVTD
jgi:hypothetical protein